MPVIGRLVCATHMPDDDAELRSTDAMAEVELYTTMYCPYCTRARAVLAQKGVSFTDIDINDHPERRAEMVRRAGGRTSVPQIFIDGRHIGGCDDLMALDRAGKLDPLLQAA